jgi:hypothetical protein
MFEKMNTRFGILALMIALAALSRFLPHPPNFTPLGGMALFGAAYFNRKYLAFAVPFLAMWLSDLALNNLVYANLYPGFAWMGSLWVYLSFGLIVLLGLGLLKKVTAPRLLGASLSASVLFFLVTNFGSWLANPLYAKNIGGLMTSYAAGIPFFWNTLAGDLIFTAVLFGVFEWMKRRYSSLSLQKA